ncbi:MAG: hypothetical protein ROO76_13110 [Terriglobia bacterium]|nr:hypothetical protein [Terriglobia bacterium]
MSFASLRETLLGWLELRPPDQVRLATIAFGVVFASLGLGEAVYRITFFQFDGATDRLPIELSFGMFFALLVMRELLRYYRRKKETRIRIRMIRARNERIRNALSVIAPLPLHQQAIRVIREEVDRIDWALAETLPN